ncbi:UNVERIFIED_CONTAM: hypothetical protein FKN15_063827 [Acipenser sinensis]
MLFFMCHILLALVATCWSCYEKGNQFVLMALDYFTKWPEAYALPDQEAETVAEALLEGFFSRFGILQELHSDQGHNFKSRANYACSRYAFKHTIIENDALKNGTSCMLCN